RFFNVPLLTIKLSRLWVTLVTGAPKEMAYPLIESLAHPMVAQRKHKVQGISDGKISFDKAARISLEQEEEYRHKKNSHSKSKKPLKSAIRSLKSDVRSVQR
ncbi:NmrA family protein, partial [Paenibacillus sp. EKM208P]